MEVGKVMVEIDNFEEVAEAEVAGAEVALGVPLAYLLHFGQVQEDVTLLSPRGCKLHLGWLVH